jgi:large subunit ribosomal protein L25
LFEKLVDWRIKDMAENKLIAVLRSQRGKNEMHRLRNQGLIPAVFYGANYENTLIAVKVKDLEQAVSHRKGLVNLKIEGSGEYEVIFRDIQRDPVTDKIQHVDLLGITRGVKMTSTLPIELVGEAVGVKSSGGILEFHRRLLDIECLPKDLPEKVVIDVTDVDIGDSIHVSDIEIENVTILTSPKSAIVSVAAPTISLALEEEEEEGEEGEEGKEGIEEGEGEESTEDSEEGRS